MAGIQYNKPELRKIFADFTTCRDMVQETAKQLTEYLRNRLNGGLRTVVVVQINGYEIQYLRPDLSGKYTRETFNEVVDTFRLKQPFLSPGIESRPVGERRAVVHYHENAFILQLPFSDEETILVSLSRDTGRNLLGFIEECRQIVNDGR